MGAGGNDLNDVPPWERSEQERSSPRPGVIKDLNDELRAGGVEAVRKSLNLAAQRLELTKADTALAVQELLAHFANGGSINDGDYLERFRRAHRMIPAAAQPIWAALERAGYSSLEITGLLNGAAKVAPATGIVENPEFPDTDKHGNPKPTFANARAAIGALGIVCRYDAFHDRLFVGGRMIEQWAGELSDYVVVMLRELIVRKFGFDPGREHTRDAAVQLCQQNKFDPVVEYLERVKWDGRARLETWLMTYLGADDNELNREIGRLMLIAAVRRARKPGCKFDQIIVLEGPEGRGKSTAIEILAGGDNFSDQLILTLDERAQQEAVTGVWLYELAEIAGISKADVDRVKAFASRTVDRARPAYGRFRVNRPRRCIFIATTNNDTYLKSQTGNRRFWPVRVGHVDIAKVIADRDQLWAEAAVLEAAGCPVTLPEELWPHAAREQERRLDHDPWMDKLEDLEGQLWNGGDGPEVRVSTTALMNILNIPLERQGDATFKRIGWCMRRLGWLGPTKLRVERDRTRVERGYRKPAPGTRSSSEGGSRGTPGRGTPAETADDFTAGN